MDTSVDDASHDKRQILSTSTFFFSVLPIDHGSHSVSATIGISISISTTLLRLFLRRGRLWYDDLFALLGLVSLLITAVGGKLYYALDGECCLFSFLIPSSSLASSLLHFFILALAAKIRSY